MKIIDDEIKKVVGIFAVLEMTPELAKEHAEKLENALIMDMAAEAFAEKGQSLEDASFTQDDVEDFLTDNYEQDEIEEILARVCRDVMVEYFSKILKGAPEDKIEKVNEILSEKFE